MKDLDVTEEVIKFNTISGKMKTGNYNTDEWWKDLKNDALRVKEELNETLEAIKNKDSLELLDGVCDIEYTLAKLKAELKNAGFDYNEAITRVCNNNNSKNVNVEQPEYLEGTIFESSHILATTYNHYNTYGDDVDIYYYEGEYGKFGTIKRMKDDKVMKPLGFQSVDISDCLP